MDWAQWLFVVWYGFCWLACIWVYTEKGGWIQVKFHNLFVGPGITIALLWWGGFFG